MDSFKIIQPIWFSGAILNRFQHNMYRSNNQEGLYSLFYLKTCWIPCILSATLNPQATFIEKKINYLSRKKMISHSCLIRNIFKGAVVHRTCPSFNNRSLEITTFTQPRIAKEVAWSLFHWVLLAIGQCRKGCQNSNNKKMSIKVSVDRRLDLVFDRI